MARVTNVVLYAVSDGQRRPIISLDAAATQNRSVAAARLMHAMTSEFSRCDRQGVPHSDIVCVEETRENAPESTQLAYVNFRELDALSLSPLVADPKAGKKSLEDLFAGRDAAQKGAQ